jgi:hypothetical protein
MNTPKGIVEFFVWIIKKIEFVIVVFVVLFGYGKSLVFLGLEKASQSSI